MPAWWRRGVLTMLADARFSVTALTRLLLVLFFCAVVDLCSAWGQSSTSVSKPLAVISYRPAGKLIYLPVQVNGSAPLWFIFDTGAPNSIIDTASAQELNIRALSDGAIHGAGRGEVSAGDAGEVQLTTDALTTHVPHMKIVDLSKVPLPAEAKGLLGAEFLEQYVVRIDPIRHEIIFYDPKTFVYAGNGKPLHLDLANSRLYIEAGLAARPGDPVARKLRVDTGSEDSIDDDVVRGSLKIQQTTLGNGLGTSYQDVSGIYDTVTIGPFIFKHVWGPAGAVPIIGMEMMRRFTLTFDAQHGWLYLEPNANFAEPVPAPS